MWFSREPACFGTPELFTEVPTMQTLSGQEGDNRKQSQLKSILVFFFLNPFLFWDASQKARTGRSV